MRTGKFFKNIRVADFSWMGVGSLITRYLAEYGAEIIKVESQNRPDPMRSMGPYKNDKPQMDGGHLFADLNSNKYSIAINLGHPKGIDIIKRLIACSDVVSESFTAGTMERLGLGYEELKKLKPDIIMVSASTMGRGGPRSQSPGTGQTLASLAGFNNITGWPDRPPSGTGRPYTDFIAPLFGAAALHAALDYRQRTGKGQYLDMAQFEASIQFLTPLVLDYTVNRRIAQGAGNYSAYAAPHGVYRCSGDDRWCAIAVSTDEQWTSFCKVIGKPEWTYSRKFATLTKRLKNHQELDKQIETWTIKHQAEEVMRTLQAVGVPAGVVQNAEDLCNDPQLRHYPAFCELNHPVAGDYIALRRGVELSKMAYEARRFPSLGEHTEYVCKQIVGMADDEFVQLMSDGVLG